MASTDIDSIPVFRIVDPAIINPCTMKFALFTVSGSGKKTLVLRASFTALDYQEIEEDFKWDKKHNYPSISFAIVGQGTGVFDLEKNILDVREYKCIHPTYKDTNIYSIFRRHIGGWRIVNT